jgi:hypothetical protein
MAPDRASPLQHLFSLESWDGVLRLRPKPGIS